MTTDIPAYQQNFFRESLKFMAIKLFVSPIVITKINILWLSDINSWEKEKGTSENYFNALVTISTD